MKKYYLTRINEIKEMDITDIAMYFTVVGLDVDPMGMDWFNILFMMFKDAKERDIIDVDDLQFYYYPFIWILGLNKRQEEELLTWIDCHLQVNRPPHRRRCL